MKGMGQKYVDKFKGLKITVKPKQLVYSDKDINKIKESL